jgi:chromosome partitioning protein
MQTIVLATQKGGSGKSTLAIGLALAAIQAGHSVRLIETDSQGTLSNWQTRRPYAEPIVEPVYVAGDVEQRLQTLHRDGVTLVIIDTSAGVSAATTSAIRYADLCLIPARPSIADIEATAATLSLARAWNKPFAYILNQTPIRGQRLNSAVATLSDEAALDLDGIVAKPFIVMRNDHQDALSAGLAVNEYAPGSKSAEEISALWLWVEAKLNGRVAVRNEVIVSNLPEAPLAPLFTEASAETAAFVS